MRYNEIAKENFSPMIQQYIEVKEKYDDTILFYRVGDFYEMFFDDAYIASRELELQLTGKDASYKERVPMCGIPFHAYLEYAKTLVSKGYKVGIVEQVEDPKSAKGLVKRDVIQIITPGTFIDSFEKDNNFITSVNKVEDIYTLTYADLSTGEIYITTLKDLNTLANEILNLNSKEIILPKGFKTDSFEILKDNYQVILSFEEESLIPNDLGYIVFGIDEKYHKSIGYLLNYIIKTQKRELRHFRQANFYTKDDYLRIDPFTKRNLELNESLRNKQKSGSLLHLLDEAETAMGSRLLHKWIDRPLKDISMINARLDIVEAFINNYVVKEDIIENLKTVYDLERIIGRVSCGNANARDLVQLKRSLQNIPNIKENLEKLNLDLTNSISSKINPHRDLFELLDAALVENPPLTIKDGGMIKEGYSKELDEIKNISKNSKDWLKNYEQEEKDKLGIKNLKIGYNRVFGYFIEISKGQLDLVKEDSGLIRKQTLANAERFISEELKNYEQIILGANDKIIKLEYDLFKELRDKVGSLSKSLQTLAEIIATVDALVSLSKVASKYNYTRPTFNTNRSVNIIEGRHPIVESMIKENYVCNDVILNSYNEVIITGPNMSGKSTYMRQLALIAVMAQIGSFVPAKVCDIMIFDQIFTRIGAEDNLTSGQSTFMVEMLEANYAISHATKDSLILFDELGRGTATFDGMALAQAIIEYVNQKIGCAMLFSTHYHELCDLVNNLKHLKNVHVEARDVGGKITFLHKVLDGASDKSYGINVASLAGLPRSVIKRSHEILDTLEDSEKNREKNVNLFNFTDYEETLEAKEEKKAFDLMKKISDLNVDDFSPKEALNFLYELKKDIE